MTFHEFLTHIFSPVNSVLTILLILSILYWILTIIGGFDIDLGLDSELEVDVDADIDTAIEVDGDVLHHPESNIEMPDSPSGFIQFLKFLSLDVIPVTFFLSLSLLFTWYMSVNLNYYVALPVWVGFLCIIPLFFISILFTKLVTIPFRSFFRQLNHKGEKAYNFIGRQGIMKTNLQPNHLGMIELVLNNDPIKLMVKNGGNQIIAQGDTVEIVGKSDDKKYYYVSKL